MLPRVSSADLASTALSTGLVSMSGDVAAAVWRGEVVVDAAVVVFPLCLPDLPRLNLLNDSLSDFCNQTCIWKIDHQAIEKQIHYCNLLSLFVGIGIATAKSASSFHFGTTDF